MDNPMSKDILISQLYLLICRNGHVDIEVPKSKLILLQHVPAPTSALLYLIIHEIPVKRKPENVQDEI